MPKKARYDLNDIAELVLEAHSCIHRVDEKLDDHRLEVTKEFGAVRERVATLEGKTEAVSQRVGVDERADKQKPVWFPKPWQMISGVCGGIGGFVVLYQIAAPVLAALNHALLAHH